MKDLILAAATNLIFVTLKIFLTGSPEELEFTPEEITGEQFVY